MIQALVLWILAAAIALIPFLAPDLILGLLPNSPETLPTWVYGVGCAGGAVLAWQGFSRWKQATKPRQPKSESQEIMVAVLSPLERQGWQVAYGLQVKGVGRVDALARSPQGQNYLIAVKSHRGKIGTDGTTIFRVYDQSNRPFEADFLGEAQQRAKAVQQAQNLANITPVLVFPEAIVEVEPTPIATVYVTGRQTLRSCLLKLG